MPDAVAHLFKLVEDHDVLTGLAQLLRLVEDLFNVGLAAGSRDDFASDVGQPLKAFAAHFRGQDRDGIAGKQFGVERAAAAVVARRGPNRFMIGRIELTSHKTGNEAAKGSADFVASGGEPLAGQNDDACFDARQLLRHFDEVHGAERSAALFGLVMPADAEQIQRIQIPKSDRLQLFLDLIRDQIRIPHLRKGRDDDAFFLCPRDRALQIVTIHGQIDHCSTPIHINCMILSLAYTTFSRL